jgi:hypothetical protein
LQGKAKTTAVSLDQFLSRTICRGVNSRRPYRMPLAPTSPMTPMTSWGTGALRNR